LASIHRQLWRLEDHVRRDDLDDAEIVDGKRRIDDLNERRQDHIARIDELLLPDDPAGGSVRYTQTPGELTDRAIIVALKQRKSRELQEDASVPTEKRTLCEEQEERFDAWRRYLVDCLDQQIEDLSRERATFPPRAEYKFYNDEDLNQAVTPPQASAG